MLLRYRNLLYHFFAIFNVSKPIAFETETRPESFETEARKMGLKRSLETETKSRDAITNDHSYMRFGFTCIQLLSDEKQEQITH